MSLADCFDYDRSLIPVADAKARLRAFARPLTKPESVPLGAAFGRVLAAPVAAPRDVPGTDNVAVDGWAFAWTPDMQGAPVALEAVDGRAAAGHPFSATIRPGQTVRVLTGAAMPEGADSVALQEEVEQRDGRIIVPAGLRRHANRRPAGEDMQAGAEILPAGHQLRAQDIGAVALMGFDRVTCFAPLRVAIVSTGDELREPGEPAGPTMIYDANRYALRAALGRLPVRLSDLGRLPDDRLAVDAALIAAAAQHDLILTSGGASQGDEDHLAAVVGAYGRMHFWRIALKPGRPLGFGQIDGAAVVCLPGNPVAAIVCFALFARPLMLALAGAAWSEPVGLPVKAGFGMRKRPGRTEMVRVRLDAASASPVARKVPKQGSGVLTSLVEASGLLELGPELAEVEVGMALPYHSHASLGLV